MDPETLVTFLFRAPPNARTVELIGSWDNFSHPYRMHPDRRRGQGAWSGCFKFLDIIFDGDQPCFHKPRTGGLKQGGTYWYYYRLDDEVEAYDDSRQTTADCPLMPGQSMNVIDVPMEIAEPVARSRSASVDAVAKVLDLESVHTLEPGDKFAALAPPPISRVHARCVSEIALVATTMDSEAGSSHSSDVARPREWNLRFAADQGVSDEAPRRARPVIHFAEDDDDDDASSIYSRQSWSSAACISEHSFIVDAYEVGSSPFADEEQAHYFQTVEELPPMPSRPPPTPSRAPPAIPASISNVLERQPSAGADVPEEAQTCASPPMPCRPPPAIPVEIPELAAIDSHEDSAEYAPSPSTPLDSHATQCPPTAFRPNLHLDLNRLTNRPHTSFQTNLTYTPSSPTKSPTDIRTTELERLRRLSRNATSNSSGEEDNAEDYDFDDDILSPTFSAATVSSRGGGVNTPFRISIGGQLCLVPNSDDPMEKVTARLRSLGNQDSSAADSLGTSSTLPASSPSIAEAENESTSSFAVNGKEAGPNNFDFLLSQRSMSPEPTSLTDAIFTELGHLGAVIA